MFYTKNVPVLERWIRFSMGIAMLYLGFFTFPGILLGYGVAALGLVAVMTGFVGFCPMCAMVGRKLDKQ